MRIIFPGRYTAKRTSSFVVFLIGMRVNRFWAFKRWLPVAQAMRPMMQILQQHPEKGLLGYENFFRLWPLETLMLSYWESFDALEQFARAQDDPHLAAWQQFMRSSNDGNVGIWHETYQVEPGGYECIYAHMPQFGLAAATAHREVSKRTHTARLRKAERTKSRTDSLKREMFKG